MNEETKERMERTPTKHLKAWLDWQKQLYQQYDGESKEIRAAIKDAITALGTEIQKREPEEVEKISTTICEGCNKVLDSGDHVVTEQMLGMEEVQKRLAIIKTKCETCLKE